MEKPDFIIVGNELAVNLDKKVDTSQHESKCFGDQTECECLRDEDEEQ